MPWSRLEANGPARGVLAGWYRLEVRCRVGEVVTHAASVEPFGVGEVFIVAGQSYATNCNDERLKVSDPTTRVVAFDSAKGTWAVAHDPQPVPDGSNLQAFLFIVRKAQEEDESSRRAKSSKTAQLSEFPHLTVKMTIGEAKAYIDQMAPSLFGARAS